MNNRKRLRKLMDAHGLTARDVAQIMSDYISSDRTVDSWLCANTPDIPLLKLEKLEQLLEKKP